MRVVFKRPIVALISDEIYEAKRANKVITKILLDKEEWAELREWACGVSFMPNIKLAKVCTLYGVKLEQAE